MQTTPIKNLVKTRDYHSYLLRQSVIWTNLKTMFLKESTEQCKQQTEVFKQHTAQVKSWKNPFAAFKTIPDESTEEQLELTNKLTLVQQRLELLENEWNRTEYYILYQFEMIEIPHVLSDSFFSFTMQEMKTALTYH